MSNDTIAEWRDGPHIFEKRSGRVRILSEVAAFRFVSRSAIMRRLTFRRDIEETAKVLQSAATASSPEINMSKG